MGRRIGDTEEYLFERDNAIVRILREFKGKNNCIKAKELSARLSLIGYTETSSALRGILARIKKDRTLPICFCDDGYFWATSQSEIRETIDALEAKMRGLQEHIDHLKQFLVF